MRQLDVGEAVDQELAEVGELMQERLVLLLDHLVLLSAGLELDSMVVIWKHRPRACNTSRPSAGPRAPRRAQPLHSKPEVSL